IIYYALKTYKYIITDLIINYYVYIKKIENKALNNTESKITIIPTLNRRIKNISNPELIKKGGKIIFFAVTGFLDDFIRIKFMVITINIAIAVLATTKTV